MGANPLVAGWFLAPVVRRDLDGEPSRYCKMDDFTAQIIADQRNATPAFTGAPWTMEECLGGYALVKTYATAPTLQAINAAAGFFRIPLARANDATASLTAAQQQAIQDRLINVLGYAPAELQAAFPLGWNGPYTLRDLGRFILTRRQEPRYDAAADAIILDGRMLRPVAFETVDAALATG